MACALVATRWAGPSQRRLFSSVSIHENNHQRWIRGVILSGSKTRLLGYVRSFSHCLGTHVGTYRMRDLPQDAGGYLPGLRNIHSLTFRRIMIENVGERGLRICFSAFRETVTHLALYIFKTSFDAFVALVDYFPNIRVLQLRPEGLKPDEGPVPTLSRPLRGKVYVDCVQADCYRFLDRFARLDLEYEGLVIDSSVRPLGTGFLQSALQISASTVKYLRLIPEFGCE